MVHPTAVIHSKAQIGADCDIGPYCVIGENVILGPGCRLHSHVVIDGYTRLGEQNEIFPFASIGLKTQDLKWDGGLTRTEIGDNNIIRECVTIHSATGGQPYWTQRDDGQSCDCLDGGIGRPRVS